MHYTCGILAHPAMFGKKFPKIAKNNIQIKVNHDSFSKKFENMWIS